MDALSFIFNSLRRVVNEDGDSANISSSSYSSRLSFDPAGMERDDNNGDAIMAATTEEVEEEEACRERVDDMVVVPVLGREEEAEEKEEAEEEEDAEEEEEEEEDAELAVVVVVPPPPPPPRVVWKKLGSSLTLEWRIEEGVGTETNSAEDILIVESGGEGDDVLW